MTGTEDEWRALMLRSVAGDAQAYRRLLELLAPRLRAFVGRRLPGDASAVEDIVQESLLAIHRYRDRYDTSQPLAPWVYAIARYKLMDHFRRASRGGVNIPIDAVAEFLEQSQPEETAAAHDIAALLKQLPPKQMTAIKLVKLEDMSVREAAAKTGMSESAIKVNIHRGIKKLATLVAKAGQT